MQCVVRRPPADSTGLKRSKENYTAQLQELNKSKPKDKGDEGLLENVARLDALLGLAKDDLVCAHSFAPVLRLADHDQNATQLRLTGLRDELKHTDSELKKLSPDHDKKAKAVELSDAKIAKLVDTVNVADDAVFNAFCKKIKVANIRDYEDVQLKMAREENEAMAEYTTQKNRIGHQSVRNQVGTSTFADTFRIEFERKQLESTRERLTTLRKGIKEAEENVKTRQSGKAELEQEVQALEKRLETLKQKLDEANTKFEEVRSKLDEVREAARRTQRDLDRSLKEIAAWNDEIEKSASDRHAIFRKCRLEEIDLPLAKGSLDKVPLLEVSNDFLFYWRICFLMCYRRRRKPTMTRWTWMTTARSDLPPSRTTVSSLTLMSLTRRRKRYVPDLASMPGFTDHSRTAPKKQDEHLRQR